jgi:hypothetical protein
MRNERLALLSLSLLSACVQDVTIGLNDAGNAGDAGIDDTGTTADTGVEITCNQAGVECVAACQSGFMSRPDLTCSAGSVCCSTEQTTCSAAEEPECVACGRSYPARCVGTEWVCDPVDCIPCNVDSECEGGFNYCENDFAAKSGICAECPPPPPLPCPDSARQLQYGNGCGYYSCDEPPESWLEIDPTTLTFFSLPIGSLRYAVSGHDPDARVCVTAIWTLGSISDAVARCGDSDPYVILVGDTDGPCGQWDYGSSVVTDSASGCYDFADFSTFEVGAEPHQDLVDLELMVTSTTHTGGIRMKNRTSTQPWPVSFTLRYGTDTPGESIWIQDRDADGKQGWVRLYADGVRLPLGEDCAVVECGGSGGGCPVAQRTARNIIPPGDFGGSATLTWDGWIYAMPIDQACVERQAAHPRNYEVELCFGRSLDTSGGEEVVENLDCRRMEFTYPTLRNQVELRIDEGG